MPSRFFNQGWKRMLPVLFVCALAGGLLLGPRLAAGASEVPLQAFDEAHGPSQEGAELFNQCVGCHTIGGGDGVGPDLEGVTTRRDRDWLVRWLLDPPAVIAEGEDFVTEMVSQFNGLEMPNPGLSEAEVEVLVAYLEEQDGGAAPVDTPTAATETPVATQAPSGDNDQVEAGRNLFTGASTLQNGGPSCRACHSIAGIGSFDGGGNLGPDLSATYARLGDAMITWPQTGTMQPIFADQTLTDTEQEHLLAFFRSTDVTERSTTVIWQLAGLAVVGAALIGLLVHLVWRGRFDGVRGPMVGK